MSTQKTNQISLVYRTLKIRRKLTKLNLSNEEIKYVKKLCRRFEALGNLFARGYEVYPPDIDSRIKNEFKYFKNEISFNKDGVKKPKKWFCRVHTIGNIQVKTKEGEKDRGCLVFIDLTKNIIRLRGFFKGKSIVVPLKDVEVKYILNRLNEGAKTKFVRVYVDDENYLNIDIVFERVKPVFEVKPNRITFIDVNDWRYGIHYFIITINEDSYKLHEKSVIRPNLRKVETLYNKAITLEKKLGKLKRLGLKYTEEYRRLRREAKNLRRKIYAVIRDVVNKGVHEIVLKVLSYKTKVIIDDMFEESRRELLEEKYSSGLMKIYLVGLKRFVKLLTNQLEWYGVPYEYKNYPSTKCPYCRIEMKLIKKTPTERIMSCPICGFTASRDEIPLHWILSEK